MSIGRLRGNRFPPPSVVATTSLSPSCASQPQPEPKMAVVSALSLVFIWSSEPKDELIISARRPLGALAPPGAISSQKKVWFQWPARHCCSMPRSVSFGALLNHDVFEFHRGVFRVLAQVIERGEISRAVPPVVDRDRACGNRRRQLRLGKRQWRLDEGSRRRCRGCGLRLRECRCRARSGPVSRPRRQRRRSRFRLSRLFMVSLPQMSSSNEGYYTRLTIGPSRKLPGHTTIRCPALFPL